MMNTEIRISKHEFRNKFKSRMTKIQNDGVVRKRVRSLKNSDLGIVSDFGLRISNLFTDFPKQNKPPASSKPVMGKDQHLTGDCLRGQAREARESTKPFRFESVFPSAKIFIDAPFSIASLEGREI